MLSIGLKERQEDLESNGNNGVGGGLFVSLSQQSDERFVTAGKNEM